MVLSSLETQQLHWDLKRQLTHLGRRTEPRRRAEAIARSRCVQSWWCDGDEEFLELSKGDMVVPLQEPETDDLGREWSYGYNATTCLRGWFPTVLLPQNGDEWSCK